MNPGELKPPVYYRTILKEVENERADLFTEDLNPDSHIEKGFTSVRMVDMEMRIKDLKHICMLEEKIQELLKENKMLETKQLTQFTTLKQQADKVILTLE